MRRPVLQIFKRDWREALGRFLAAHYNSVSGVIVLAFVVVICGVSMGLATPPQSNHSHEVTAP